ncbi:MAG TPA: hypothetical protein VMU69_11805 [Bradyrhizobium sp.]|nr:hypothetical protein [Bradyrhizobium sp.]
MSTISSSDRSIVQDAASYGGVADAVGGIVTVVLAVIALAGAHEDILLAIATIVFGTALLIEGGAILSEYVSMSFPTGTYESAEGLGGGGGLSALFLTGAAGIVLGVLALIAIHPQTLSAIAVIAFGGALVLGSSSLLHLNRARQMSYRSGTPRKLSGGEIIAVEMASGAAVMQGIAGLAAIVLGILAVTGHNPSVLSLVGLLVLGAAVILTGNTLSGAVMSFVGPTTTTHVGESWAQQRPAE